LSVFEIKEDENLQSCFICFSVFVFDDGVGKLLDAPWEKPLHHLSARQMGWKQGKKGNTSQLILSSFFSASNCSPVARAILGSEF